jgi:hypothetical protein
MATQIDIMPKKRIIKAIVVLAFAVLCIALFFNYCAKSSQCKEFVIQPVLNWFSGLLKAIYLAILEAAIAVLVAASGYLIASWLESTNLDHWQSAAISVGIPLAISLILPGFLPIPSIVSGPSLVFMIGSILYYVHQYLSNA